MDMLELQRWLYGEAGTQLKALASGTELSTLLGVIWIAAFFGLVHAVMPGHGKTVLVSYFLGRPANVIAGLTASVTLVLTHVGSAIDRFFHLLSLTASARERIGQALELVSSIAILALGCGFSWAADLGVTSHVTSSSRHGEVWSSPSHQWR
jgi:nickel/cobalt transporter (NicO) family protein